MVPTPRTTRLIRVADLTAYRQALVSLALEGAPLDARDRFLVVPTRAAASLLVRSIEDAALPAAGALALPDLLTPRELVARLADRLSHPGRLLGPAEREALLGAACRVARAQTDPPFQIRPGLVAEMLRFYDGLRRRQNSVDDFERRALGLLEPGAATDRGAERLVRQTQFLVATFREFERRQREQGGDEHDLLSRLIAEPCPRPYRHAVLAVTDEAFDAYGLAPAEWDLLTRLPGLGRLDLVVTDTVLAGALHERIHRMLPGIEETRYERLDAPTRPVLVIPPGSGLVHASRDREEEVSDVARRVKAAVRDGTLSEPALAALVVCQRLPYVYLAREVFRSAGVPCQMFDALPLAAEPFAAAFDLALTAVGADFARVPAIALLRSPHLQLAAARDVTALDRALAEDGYLGGADALERLLDAWREVKDGRRRERALRAGDTLLGIARELAPLRSPAPVSAHLQVLVAFLSGHEAVPALDEALRARHLRARAAVLTTLVTLRDAFARHDPEPVSSDDAAALVRRWIEAHTFAPRAGDSGVHVVDADSARFGRFEHVHLAGVIDDEWPERPRRSIFYSPAVLKELGWPAEVDRRAAARAAFVDLLRLPSSRLSVSRFLLEADALVSPSPLLDELEHAALDAVEQGTPARRIFESEALYGDPLDVTALSDLAREWAERRQHPPDLPPDRFRGQALPLAVRPFSLSALERYQDCPFKFFAADILGLEEDPEDESTLSPRARGRFVHEVFQRFYEAWEAREGGAITSDRIDEATALMHEVAEPLLARLPDADAALERARLFGSAISTGSLELVLSHEASSGGDVRGRLLEHRLEGEFTLGSPDGRHVALRGVADRVDLLAGNRLRLVDYKTGSAPVAARALQAAIYALCAQERLQARDGRAWEIEEVVYLAFSGKRPQVSIVKAAEGEPEKALGAARDRLRRILDRIAGGQFPPQPHDPIICDFCAYASVCRKDYVHD